jgi:hypothetical protein
MGAHSLPSCLTCLSGPGRASEIQSSPRAGGAGRAKSARFDGVKLVRLASQKQVNKLFYRYVPCSLSLRVRRSRKSFSEPLADRLTLSRTRTPRSALSLGILISLTFSQRAPAGRFLRRPLNLNSHNHNQRDRRRRFYLAVVRWGQRLLHTTIFPSLETAHHTSVRMRFMRTRCGAASMIATATPRQMRHLQLRVRCGKFRDQLEAKIRNLDDGKNTFEKFCMARCVRCFSAVRALPLPLAYVPGSLR